MAIICTSLGGYFWVFDLVTSFSWHIYILSLFISILMLFNKKILKGAILLFLSMFLLIDIYPSDIRAEAEIKDNVIRVASFNLLSTNTNADPVLAYVDSIDPDILLILEYTSFWDVSLKNSIGKRYPYHINRIQEDNFGIGFFSKYPLNNFKIIDFTNSYFPTIYSKVNINGSILNFLGVHYENPMGRRNHNVREMQINKSIDLVSDLDNVVYMGDFNLTPYSKEFKRIEDFSGLVDTRYSISASWPTYFWPLSIPIDHCFISPNIQLIDRIVGPHIGSDHLPIIIDIAL